ncbi:hypothetical protein [Burkholderia cenocepacia]|uniref:hypothetical protein n=1 Tax=Burkholderia cenocepacia TaxID=95486 RepID=UPI000846E4B1|nr:hypothetical protein [Burkholderia cenocepacia]
MARLSDIFNRIERTPKENAATMNAAFPFGGGAVNQTMIQVFMSETLLFSGVGTSGVGKYHGKYGFDSLSHAKSIAAAPSGQRIDVPLPPFRMQAQPASRSGSARSMQTIKYRIACDSHSYMAMANARHSARADNPSRQDSQAAAASTMPNE